MDDHYHVAIPGASASERLLKSLDKVNASVPGGDISLKLKDEGPFLGEDGQEDERRHSKRTPKPNGAYIDTSPLSSSSSRKVIDGEPIIDVEGGNEEGNIDDPEFADTHSGLGSALPAIKKYFFSRLCHVLVSFGAEPDCLETWGTQCIKRPGGLVQGLIDVYYYNGKGRKFRSRVEAAVSLGLMPYARQLRYSTKEQLFVTAMETRERYLVAQKLFMNGGRCENIQYVNDDIIMTVSEEDLTAAAVAAAAGLPGPTTIDQGSSSSSSSSSSPFYGLLQAPSPEPPMIGYDPNSLGLGGGSPATDPSVKLPPPIPPLVIHKEGFFSWGNVTIIDWGKINTDPHFHTVTQIFPVGFKCVRQEHDIILDRVVDCVCEILTVFDTDPSGLTNGTLVPLFRISVGWDLGLGAAGKTVVRTYDARSPQQAWQAAMLETLGIDEPSEDISAFQGNEGDASGGASSGAAASAVLMDVTVDPSTASSAATAIAGTIVESTEEEEYPNESMDDEEKDLRAKIREKRRTYFRALRQEQSQGVQAAVKPRLVIEAVDSFVDTSLLRVIEGMDGALDCRAYQFVDYRDRDAGRKSLLKNLAQVHYKGKLLDRVQRKAASGGGGRGGGGSSGGGVGDKKRQRLDEEEKKRRVGEMEARKKARVVDKEARIRQMMANANRKNEVKTRIRDMEKTVRGIKEVLVKTIRKRRDEARVRVEVVNDREEAVRTSKLLAATTAAAAADEDNVSSSLLIQQQQTQTQTQTQQVQTQRESMPEPSSGIIRVDGDVYGQTLELWGFLSTFAVPLRLNTIPHIQKLANAFKACDSAYKRLRARTRGADRSFDVVSGSIDSLGLDFTVPEPIDAAALLDSVGLALCEILMADFNKIMGLEAAEASLGNLYVPLNELTWREIFRMVQIGISYKEIGMSDPDIAATLKGRGYHTTPETADRKALKIARRRIMFNYTIREENQEALFGFNSGLCLRIPTPTNCDGGDAEWYEIIATLRDVSDNSVWLVNDVIEYAMVLCDRTVQHPLLVRRLKKSLRMCTQPPIFSNESAAAAKRLALSLLRYAHTDENGRPITDLPTTATAGSVVGAAAAAARKLPSSSNDSNIVATSISSASPTACCASSVTASNSSSTTTTTATGTGDNSNDADDNLNDEFCLDCSSARINHRPHEVPTNSFSQWARQSSLFTRTARAAYNITNGFALDANEDDVEAAVAVAMIVDAENMLVDEDKEKERENKQKPEEVEDDLVKETVAAEKLSIAMQRCYLVIRDLMSHSSAASFCNPVDPRTVPLYYKAMSQPLSFADIKKTLLETGYADSITKFYCDVNLVLENALAYNPDGSPVNIAAQKLLMVFDRMFLETVLSWDNPVPFSDSCLGCRSTESLAHCKYAQCERCDAYYHLGCLDPPMTFHPRTEWYCPSCIEQKGIASVHPNRTAEVLHPDDKELRGIVVGIEQIKHTLRFVVEFGSRRELWSGEKVRKYNVPPVRKFDFSEPHHHTHLAFEDDKVVAQSPRPGNDDGESSSPRPVSDEKVHAVPRSNINSVTVNADGTTAAAVALGMTHSSGAVSTTTTAITAAAAAADAAPSTSSTTVSETAAAAAPPSAMAKAFPGFTPSLPPVETVPPPLPSGYSYDDYDIVCGFARGHVGWGTPLNMLPPVLSDTHSTAARNRGVSDPFFNLHRAALVALSPQADSADLDAQEWLALLRSLAQRLVATPQLSAAVAGTDEQEGGGGAGGGDGGTTTQEDSMDHIIGGTGCYDNLIRKARCLIADGIVIGDPPVVVAVSHDDGRTGLTTTSPAKTDSIAPSSARGLTPKEQEEHRQREQRDSGGGIITGDGSSSSSGKPPIAGKKRGRKPFATSKQSGGDNNLSARFEDADEDALKATKANATNAASCSNSSSSRKDDGDDDQELLRRGDSDDDSDADILDDMDYGDSSDEAEDVADPENKMIKMRSDTPTSLLDESMVDDDDVKSRVSLGEADASSVAGTAAGAGASATATATVDWELRRQSRKKGREDALLTQNLVWEVLKDVDLDGEKDEYGNPVDPEFYGAVFTSVVKACLSRASEYLDVGEWSKGWGHHMDAFIDQHAGVINKLIDSGTSRIERKNIIEITPEVEAQQSKEVFCQLCGFNEEYLASQLIMGQSFLEWEQDQDLTLSSAAIATDKRRRFLYDANGNGNKVWIPYCQRAGEIELRECAIADKDPRNGTIVAHECCAEFLAVFRSVSMTKARRAEEQKIVNILSFVGSAKNAPIGTDREGSNYWIFAGSPAVYVCTEVRPYFPTSVPDGISANFFAKGKKYLTGCYSHSSSAATGSGGGGGAATGTMARNRDVFSLPDGSSCYFSSKDTFFDPNNSSNSSTATSSSRSYVWRVYESMADIGRLVRWLDVREPDERLLKRILMLLYPNALVATSSAATATATATAITAATDDNGVLDLFSEIDNATTTTSSATSAATASAASASFSADDTTTKNNSCTENKATVSSTTSATTATTASSGDVTGDDDQATESEVDEDDVMGDDDQEEEDDGGDDDQEAEMDFSAEPRVSGRVRTSSTFWNGGGDSNDTAAAAAGGAGNGSAADISGAGGLKIGQKVIVPSGGFSGIPWDARVVEIRTVENRRRRTVTAISANSNTYSSSSSATAATAAAAGGGGSGSNDSSTTTDVTVETIYRVRFERWGSSHDGWYRRNEIKLPTNNSFVDRTLRMRARHTFTDDHVYAVPDVLQTLYAYPYLYAQDRACAVEGRPALTFSDTVTPLGMVKAAMLLLEACLPNGCVDDAEDRWGNNFVLAWREAVVSAADATALMQCQIMLEYGIRTAWYTTPGLKLMSCMPSRLQSMRIATVSLVAMRVWCLDQAIRYDKVGLHDKSSPAAGASQKRGRGRGKKKLV